MSRVKEKTKRPDRAELIARLAFGVILGAPFGTLAAVTYFGPGWHTVLIGILAAIFDGYWATRNDWWQVVP